MDKTLRSFYFALPNNEYSLFLNISWKSMKANNFSTTWASSMKTSNSRTPGEVLSSATRKGWPERLECRIGTTSKSLECSRVELFLCTTRRSSFTCTSRSTITTRSVCSFFFCKRLDNRHRYPSFEDEVELKFKKKKNYYNISIPLPFLLRFFNWKKQKQFFEGERLPSEENPIHVMISYVTIKNCIFSSARRTTWLWLPIRRWALQAGSTSLFPQAKSSTGLLRRWTSKTPTSRNWRRSTTKLLLRYFFFVSWLFSKIH